MKKEFGLWSILAPVKLKVILSMFVASLSTICFILGLTVLSFILSSIVKNSLIVFFDIKLDLYWTISLLAILVVSTFLLRFLAFILSHLAAFKLEEILRTKLSSHFAKVPLGYVISNGSGTLKKVMQTDVKNLHTFVADSIPMIAKSILAPIFSLAILLYVDYKFALASIFILIFGSIAMSIAMKDSKSFRENYEQSQSDIDKAVIEFVQAMPVVRTFDDGSQSFKRYNNSLITYKNNLNQWMSKSAVSAKLGMLILSPLPTLIFVLFVGVLLLNSGLTQLSSFILALFLSTGMADAMMPLMWMNNFIKKSQASAIKIQEVLTIEPLKETSKDNTPKNFDLTFKEVSFKYENTKNYALKNINFKIKQNSTTAIVGPSGSGKSTIAKLIPRFWDISKGEITIDNINIKDIKSHKLMDIVSFVFQDTFLFHDTIFDNIKMAKSNTTKDEVIKAAKAAQIHDFITSLPNGYETKAGDRGTLLSGGQKQRITIARAILRDTPIVVLDEATAFADPQSEELIIKALANLMKNKTVIIIAHRLSTIKDIEQIIVLDKGEIVEIGNHKKLLENEKIYFNLWKNYQKAQNWNLSKGENYE